MFVIGVAGQAQMGKDTLSDYLQLKLNEAGGKWVRSAFASNVKKVFCDTFDVDINFVEQWKVNAEVPPSFNMNVRSSLQFIGDGFRKIMPTIWIDLTFREKTTAKIISDVRYVNEFKRVKQEGGLNILIGRSNKLNDDPNGSEAQIRPYVQYALKKCVGLTNTLADNFVILNDLPKHYWTMADAPPPDFDMFDIFIRNDGTKEDLYRVIDECLVPYVQHYVFDMPIEKEGNTQCLISN